MDYGKDYRKTPSFLGEQVVVPTKQSRPLMVDAEQLEHDALIGRWFRRLLPVVCVAYIVYALATRASW